MDTRPKIYFQEKINHVMKPPQIAILEPTGELQVTSIQIAEYYSVEVWIECEYKEAILEIERVETEELLRIPVGEKRMICSEGDSDDMIVPGDYSFRITTSTHIYEGLYRVSPKNMTWDNMAHLRAYLERFLTGLSYQLMKRSSGQYMDEQGHYPVALQIYHHIDSKFSRLRRELDSLFQDPNRHVVKVYQEQYGSRKPDARSMRWLSQKGLSKNSQPYSPTVVFEKKITLSANTPENQWVIWFLRFLQFSLRKLELSFHEHVLAAEARWKHKKSKLEEAKRRQAMAQSDRFAKGIKRNLYRLNQEIERYGKEVDHLQVELERIKENMLHLKRMTASLARFDQSEWTNEVTVPSASPKVMQMMYKDPRYHFLYRMYQELTKMQRKEIAPRQTVFPSKKTSLLFEYYTLGLIIEILQFLSLEWTKGWLAETTNPFLLMGQLTSGEVLTFEHEDYFVEVAYDKEIESLSDRRDYSRFIANAHNMPDIRISVFRYTGELLGSMIVEVKCRRFEYIYRDAFDTDVMEQLKAYKDIQYYDASKDDVEYPVRKVVTVYPKQSGAKPYDTKYFDKYVFIQIEPTDPDSEEKPFGYSHLHSTIEGFLQWIEGKIGGVA
jgi:hypothetical protein